MRLGELLNLIQKSLSSEGFFLTPLFRNTADDSYWVLGDELRLVKVAEGWSAEAASGLCLAVRRVPNFNDQRESVSYYLDAVRWERNSSRRLDRVKISMRSSARFAESQVREFASRYRMIVTESEVESILSAGAK